MQIFQRRRPYDASKLEGGRKHKRGTGKLRGSTKFARYDAGNSAMGAGSVREHVLTDMYRLVVAAHLAPDQPVRLLLQADMDGDLLLSGAVPQPADWLRAWRVCMSPKAWTQAADDAHREHCISQIRTHSVKPRAHAGHGGMHEGSSLGQETHMAG